MKAFYLLLILIVAKLAMLAGRPVDISFWFPFAYFWQDVLVSVVFGVLVGLFDRFSIGRGLTWLLYGLTVFYVAINVPVARVLSSPLSWPMMGATRGTLSDSIKHHLTTQNILLMLLVIALGVSLPFLAYSTRLFTRVNRTFVYWEFLFGVVFVLLGPLAVSRIDTVGMDRNAITILATTALPRISANARGIGNTDWRTGPVDKFDQGIPGDDLFRWRGAASGRNVVLILLESAGAKYLSIYGASNNPMPNLADMTRSSLVFENAYSVYPESIKGLFSVLCSRYPAMDTVAETYSSITTPSIAAILKGAGYHTALFHSGRFMYLGMESVVANRGYDVLEDAGSIGGNIESSFGVDDQYTVQRALSWVDQLGAGDHFFLTYLPIAGHHPYEAPEAGPFRDRTDEDRYLNALHYADATLESLVRGLRERGLENKTLFVVFGDHGEAFGQHDGNFGHSLFLYDENIRVPYLISAPGLIEAAVHVSRPISLIDTAPTILDLLGIKLPPVYQGVSAIRSETQMALFYTDYSLSLVGLRDGRWKYLYELESGRSKLFDLSVDASELSDLSSANPDRVSAYRRRVCDWAADQKALIKQMTNKPAE